MTDCYARTDLACEGNLTAAGQQEGTDQTEHRVGGYLVSRLRIRSETAAERIGKPVGCYVTVECGRIDRLNEDGSEQLARIIAGELRGMAERLSGKTPDAYFGVFVAGLGNAELTADAIGPQTVAQLTATRHLREYEESLYRSIGCSSLSALAPGVLGQTGIETLELLRGAVRYVKPDVAVVIDALSARSCHRLASTVQLSDAGIEPGSGVGNHRSAVTRKTLGVPVIVVGVPTVVDSSTLVYDALQQANIEEISDSLRAVLENGKSFFVSPKECDVITQSVSALLARAIGMAFTGDLRL